MKTRVCLKYFIHDCLPKQFFYLQLVTGPFKHDLLSILATLKPLAQLQPEIKATKLEKSAKICLN